MRAAVTGLAGAVLRRLLEALETVLRYCRSACLREAQYGLAEPVGPYLIEGLSRAPNLQVFAGLPDCPDLARPHAQIARWRHRYRRVAPMPIPRSIARLHMALMPRLLVVGHRGLAHTHVVDNTAIRVGTNSRHFSG